MEIEFIEKEEHHKGFALHFKEKILPKLSSLETKRLELLKEYKKRLPIGFFGAIIVLILFEVVLNQNNTMDFEDTSIIFAIIGGLAFFWIYTPKIKFKKLAKESIVSGIASFFGLNYVHEQNLDTDPIIKSKLFPHFNRVKSEDHFNGKLEDLNFTLAEVNLSYKKDKNSVTIFFGEIVEIEMLKNFQGHTVIVEENQTTNLTSGLFNKVDERYQLVTLEDPEFEKIYKVYSTDQIEARYLLTTSFMERILKLKEVLGMAKIKVSFLDNKILLGISSYRDLFEPKGIDTSVYDLSDIYKFLDEINEYKKLIQTLKLNQNLGL